MARRRFQVDDVSAPVIRVGGDQATHALRVLRLQTGAEVELFNGRGDQVEGKIVAVGPSEFEVEVTRRKATDERIGPALLLAVAMPKGPRGDWLVEKCAELGVSRLWPLACERGQVEPGEGKLARWKRKAVEAAKQSRQSSTMIVEATTGLAALLEKIGGGSQIYFGEPGRAGLTLAEELSAGESRTPSGLPILVLIGPEGGFTHEECLQIESAGGKAVQLALTILRIETAAVATAALWAGWIASNKPGLESTGHNS